MRLVRTPNIRMLADALDLELDDGRLIRVAEPNAGYWSASGYSSHNDVVFSWRARLYASTIGPLVFIETRESRAGDERSEPTFYAVRSDGAITVVPALLPEHRINLDQPIDEVSG